VAEDRHRDPDVDALGDHHRAGGVPGVVEAVVLDAWPARAAAPPAGVHGRVERAAVLEGEHEAAVGPVVAELEPPLRFCSLAVRLEARRGATAGVDAAADFSLFGVPNTMPCR
jgi:hypothetical protein